MASFGMQNCPSYGKSIHVPLRQGVNKLQEVSCENGGKQKQPVVEKWQEGSYIIE